MNIVWITGRHYPPENSESAMASGRLVDGLRGRGHPVHLVHLQDVTAKADGNKSMQAIYTPPEKLFAKEKKRLHNTLIVGFGSTWAGYLATLWAKWSQSKSVVLFRGHDFDVGLHDPRSAALVHFILDHADLITTVSLEMCQRIRSLRTKPVITTPPGIDARLWENTLELRENGRFWRAEHLPRSNKPVITFWQRPGSDKGFDLLAQLFSQLGFFQEASLLTFGDIVTQHYDPLKKLLDEHWIHLPYPSPDEIPYILSSIDLLTFPSWSDGIPQLLLEALSLERIVACSLAGGFPDIIQHGKNGFLFDIGDLTQAAAAIHAALSLSKEEQRNMGLNARETILQNYSLNREIDTLENALKKIGL